jgi:hypothetical protein
MHAPQREETRAEEQEAEQLPGQGVPSHRGVVGEEDADDRDDWHGHHELACQGQHEVEDLRVELCVCVCVEWCGRGRLQRRGWTGLDWALFWSIRRLVDCESGDGGWGGFEIDAFLRACVRAYLCRAGRSGSSTAVASADTGRAGLSLRGGCGRSFGRARLDDGRMWWRMCKKISAIGHLEGPASHRVCVDGSVLIFSTAARTEALDDEVIERMEGPGLRKVLQEAPKVLCVCAVGRSINRFLIR